MAPSADQTNEQGRAALEGKYGAGYRAVDFVSREVGDVAATNPERMRTYQSSPLVSIFTGSTINATSQEGASGGTGAGAGRPGSPDSLSFRWRLPSAAMLRGQAHRYNITCTPVGNNNNNKNPHVDPAMATTGVSVEVDAAQRSGSGSGSSTGPRWLEGTVTGLQAAVKYTVAVRLRNRLHSVYAPASGPEAMAAPWFKTGEDVPDGAPRGLATNINDPPTRSTARLQWDPPAAHRSNGVITQYKIEWWSAAAPTYVDYAGATKQRPFADCLEVDPCVMVVEHDTTFDSATFADSLQYHSLGNLTAATPYEVRVAGRTRAGGPLPPLAPAPWGPKANVSFTTGVDRPDPPPAPVLTQQAPGAGVSLAVQWTAHLSNRLGTPTEARLVVEDASAVFACTDGVWNGYETGLDCGGTCNTSCGAGGPGPGLGPFAPQPQPGIEEVGVALNATSAVVSTFKGQPLVPGRAYAVRLVVFTSPTTWSISARGAAITVAAPPEEAAGVQDAAGGGGGGGGGGGTAAAVVIVILLLIAAAGAVVYYKKRQDEKIKNLRSSLSEHKREGRGRERRTAGRAGGGGGGGVGGASIMAMMGQSSSVDNNSYTHADEGADEGAGEGGEGDDDVYDNVVEETDMDASRSVKLGSDAGLRIPPLPKLGPVASHVVAVPDLDACFKQMRANGDFAFSEEYAKRRKPR